MVSEAGLEPASCLFRVKGKTLNLIKNYILLHNLSTDHFDLKKHNRKYKVITKTCPACANTFIAQKNHPREKQTCSRACSNRHFRSGKTILITKKIIK